MSFKKWWVGTGMFFIIFTAMPGPGTGMSVDLAQPKVEPQTPPQIEFITAEELKAQIAKNQPLTIIDVRSTGGSGDAERKIKGAIHAKSEKLNTRSPLLPRKERPPAHEGLLFFFFRA